MALAAVILPFVSVRGTATVPHRGSTELPVRAFVVEPELPEPEPPELPEPEAADGLELALGAVTVEEVPEAPTRGATTPLLVVLNVSSRIRPATVLSRVRMARRISGAAFLGKW